MNPAAECFRFIRVAEFRTGLASRLPSPPIEVAATVATAKFISTMETDFYDRRTNPFEVATDTDAFFPILSIRRLEVETRARVFEMERLA